MTRSMALGLLALFFPLLGSAAQENSLEAFLNRHAIIRVYIATSRQGFGHTAASLNTISRLRDYGYRNKIQAVYDVEARRVIEALVWEFQFREPGYFDEQKNVEWIPHKTWLPLHLEKCSLGVVGGADQPLNRSDLRVDELLHLSPLSWLGDNVLETGDGRILLPEFSKRPFHFSYLSDEQFEGWLDTSSTTKYQRQARQALRAWWALKESVVSTIAYDVPDELLIRYLTALRSFKNTNFPGKPLFVLYQSPEQKMLEYLNFPIPKAVFSYIDIDEFHSLEELDPRRIYVLHFKSELPLKIQGTLLGHIQLPPTAAGGVQVNMALQQGFWPLPVGDSAIATISNNSTFLSRVDQDFTDLVDLFRLHAYGALDDMLELLANISQPGYDWFQEEQHTEGRPRQFSYDKLFLALQHLESFRGALKSSCRGLLAAP